MMNAEPDALDLRAHPDEQAEGEADDALDWDLGERDRYMAEHEDFEEDPEIDVLVKSDE
jgi:hypothetical protein